MSSAFWVQLRRELGALLLSPVAYVLLFLFSLVTAVVYYLAFQVITEFALPVEWGALGLCYLIVLLIGMFYISIGVLASSLSSSQIVSALITFAGINLMLFLPGIFIEALDLDAAAIDQLRYFFSPYHFREFVMGTFDTRPIIFHLSGIVLFLVLTYGNLISRKLKS